MSIYVRDAAGNRQKIAGVGLPGPAGKSAYQYAVEGGFSGTEEEFRAVVGVRSNPNLLDNWYFAGPINQRGQNVYTTTGFTIDRWFGFSDGETYPMRVEVTKTGLYFPNSNNGINQRFEPALDTKITYTFSFMEDTGEVYSSKIVPEEYIDLNGTHFGLFYQGAALFFKPASGKKFIAVKLELGPVQTLAHKDASGTWVLNDPPPNKALELAKCQRYQEKVTSIRTGNSTLGGYVVVGGEYNRLLFAEPIPFKIRKRVMPIIKDVILVPILDDGTATTEMRPTIDWSYCTEDALFQCAVSSQYAIEPGRKYYISFLADANL